YYPFTLCCTFFSSFNCTLLSFTSSFFFNYTATTQIYTLSLHDALPIYTNAHPRIKLPIHLRFILFSPLLSQTEKLFAFLLRLGPTDGLRQSVVADEQIHLDPFTGAVLVHRQSENTEGAALHSNAENGGVIGIGRQNSRQ